MAAPPRESRIPRWLVSASWPVSGVLLTLFFVFLGFPYDLLALRLSDQALQSMNLRLSIGDLSPHVGPLGLGLVATDVLAAQEGRNTIAVDELILRPAWSLAWFRWAPALYIDVTSQVGSGSGTLTLGDEAGWKGELRGVQLEQLPIEMPESGEIEGLLDADVDLHRSIDETGAPLVGSVDFSVRDGILATSNLQLAMPFERLHGQLRLGGDSYLSFSQVKLEGPMITGMLEGEVGHGPTPEQQLLAIDIRYEVRDPGLEQILTGIGARDRDGVYRVSLGGTLARPVVR